MNVLDLFSGMEGWSTPARDRGHNVVTLDNCQDGKFQPTFPEDIRNVLRLEELEMHGRFDVVFASPPCTAFSVQVIGRNWIRGQDGHASFPKNQKAIDGLSIARHTFGLILAYNPKFWVIENPMGAMRSVLNNYDCYRDWTAYCRWQKSLPVEQRRMKPTDLWRGGFLGELPKCYKRFPDHAAAPRGSTTGTQGMGPARVKSLIPYDLALAHIKAVEDGSGVVICP